MREMEDGPPKVMQKSPEKKRPRLESPPITEQRPTLEEITNSIRSRIEPVQDLDNSYKVPRLGERKVYRRMPIEGDCQSFTMNDGERFYVKLLDKEVENIDTAKMSKPSR